MELVSSLTSRWSITRSIIREHAAAAPTDASITDVRCAKSSVFSYTTAAHRSHLLETLHGLEYQMIENATSLFILDNKLVI